MTETQDQLSVLPSAANGAASPAQERAKRRSGSLSSMLLPELQALASSMGISTGKLRKSDLIAAIEAAQRSGGGRAGSAPATNGAATNGAVTHGAATAGSSVEQPATADAAATAPVKRARRAASRAAGTPQHDRPADSASQPAAEARTAPESSATAPATSRLDRGRSEA